MPVSVAGPVGSCLVCGTPRTGSSLLLGLTGGQHPDITNYYLAWGQQWPAQFISQAGAAGATL
jgi:hypothetical protein